MTATVSGTVAVEHDVAATYLRRGSLDRAEAVERFTEQLPHTGVPLDIEHTGVPVGELVWGSIDAGGRLAAVCVVDDDAAADVLLEDGAAMYFSPTLLAIGAGVRTRQVAIADAACLVGLSLTLSPAGHGLPAVDVRPGDVRHSIARANWPMSGRSSSPLLERCVDALGDRDRVAQLERSAQPVPHDSQVNGVTWTRDAHGNLEPVFAPARPGLAPPPTSMR